MSGEQALQQLKLLQGKKETRNSAKQSKSNKKNARNNSKKNNGKSQEDKKTKQEKELAQVEEHASEEGMLENAAFKQVLSNMYPLSYERLLKVHQAYNDNQFALAATPGTPPKPVSTSQLVSLAPGATPPALRVAQNFVSSVIFLDSTGAPWPLVGYDLGDPGAFSIQWDKKSNLLMIQSKKMYTYGNIAIKLAGLNTPVMLTLVPGQKAIDYRIDMRVQGFGPNAKDLPTGLGLPASADNVLLSVLEGIAPNGSTELTVKGGPASAWKLGDKLYVRTGLKILSPGWLATMNSGDGTNAYEMQIAPVLLVSWHGRVMQLQIEGL
jgi:intracellular multiplication protein IcmK